MADIQHYCHTCNESLTVTRDGTKTTVACPRCDFVREYTFKSPAERQAKVRQRRALKDAGLTGLTILHLMKGTKVHGRTTRCPECLGLLKSINLNQTTARKGCLNCRRKFEYIRTDTPEGRKLRVQQWRKNKNVTTILTAE